VQSFQSSRKGCRHVIYPSLANNNIADPPSSKSKDPNVSEFGKKHVGKKNGAGSCAKPRSMLIEFYMPLRLFKRRRWDFIRFLWQFFGNEHEEKTNCIPNNRKNG